ncbi:mechanosensitive ion channel family protein [Waterburya agarophytonicola K14]|uniref:Mechanosensitive ion channel family protein n=1 Tax=Waterburya agarophytonicola KI4 TaxID=2874699 RepID=A0A964FEC1_9CYAN|nr:mechanosensitive ion channel family protein [Waterburya agarophytonicola]MCC0176470.1 mechanosensitive ion channel family protein [Waterburya agarophytonicola KI4]
MSKIIDTIVQALLELFGQGVKTLPGLLSAFVVLFLTKYAVELVLKIADETGKRTIKSSSLQLLLLKISRIGVWSVGILLACVLAFPSFELADIIATLGVGSVAIGFAFQDIFKNFLAGIILLIEEPFRIGDEIVIGDYQGKVENISIRTTKLRTYNGERVLLPNSTVFTDAVKVVTAYASRRTDLAVGVDYNTPLDQAIAILQETISTVAGVLETPSPEIDVVNFGDSSIDFIVRYWTSPQQKQLRKVQTKAMIKVKQALDEAEIGIPYPIRTVYHFDQEKYNDYFPVESKTQDN